MKLWALRTAVPFLTISAILLWSLGPSADSGFPVGQFETSLARFNTAGPPAYRAFRRLEAGLPGTNKQGWMEVWTEFRPGTGFAYEVVREEGYEYVRNRVLRGVLKGEAELLANGKPLRAALAARNYRFEDGGITESGLTRVLLYPNRKGEGIVSGSTLIEPDTGAVVRIEGRLDQEPVLLGARRRRDVEVHAGRRDDRADRVVVLGARPLLWPVEFQDDLRLRAGRRPAG